MRKGSRISNRVIHGARKMRRSEQTPDECLTISHAFLETFRLLVVVIQQLLHSLLALHVWITRIVECCVWLILMVMNLAVQIFASSFHQFHLFGDVIFEGFGACCVTIQLSLFLLDLIDGITKLGSQSLAAFCPLGMAFLVFESRPLFRRHVLQHLQALLVRDVLGCFAFLSCLSARLLVP